MKLGSLFDGSGGFPLAGALCGIEPCWASEVEPYPIAVTRGRFPNVRHLGDISKINGAEIEPVDIITFGSPCQDLSVAGKRAGLKHEANGDEETTRSGLFMEAVRIIKEMREATNGNYPRFALWENVPGAFSSNKGEDFRIVLEELIKIVEPTAVMPAVPKGGWAYADSYCGAGWSLAYRVFDAQYWGVPQRRRRIHLIADFRGQCAQEVLFEREGVRGYSAESRASWQEAASNAERGVGADDREGESEKSVLIHQEAASGGDISACLYAAYGTKWNGNSGAYSGENFVMEKRAEGLDGYNAAITGEVSATLGVNCGTSTGRNGIIAVATQQGGAEISENGVCPTITAAAGMSGNNQPWICKPAMAFAQNQRDEVRDLGDKAGALQAEPGMKQQTFLAQPVTFEPGILRREGGHIYEGVAGTLRANAGDNQLAVAQAVADTNILDDQGGQQISVRTDGKSPTLRAEAHGNMPCIIETAGFCTEHSAKSRSIGYEEEISPTLRAGVTPAVVCKTWDARGNVDGEIVSTLTGDHENRITDYTSVVCLQGNGIDRADTAGCNGKGWRDDVCYTLNTIDRPAVCYTLTHQGFMVNPKADGVMDTLMATDHKDPPVIAIDRAAFNQGQNAQYEPQYYTDGTVSTLVARGPSAVCYWDGSQTCGTLTANNAGGNQRMPDKENFNCVLEKQAVYYIVRRLTPTECARLQGFPDTWGHIGTKDDLTDEEWTFWTDVRNTHAAINGKAVKEYTKAQMLTWYNKLHTDSAEYKMWGNGIALPPALYCMQGIVEALKEEAV